MAGIGTKFARAAKSLIAIPIVNFPPNMISILVHRWTNAVPKGIHFPVNPESLVGLRRYLVTVTNTLDGGWVDDFGPAPSPITLRGTFGYKVKAAIDGQGIFSGFGWLKYLEHLVDESHIPDDNGDLPETWLLSWISQHFFTVVLEDFNFSQSIDRNMIWQYTLRLTALKPIGQEFPALDPVFALMSEALSPTGGVAGNYLKSVASLAIGNQ